MAYREFHYEKQYAAPDTSEFLDQTNASIGNLFRAISDRQDLRRKTADQYKFDLENGYFENDNKILQQHAANTVALGKEAFRKNDATLKNQLSMQEKLGRQFAGQRDAQANRFKEMNASVDKRASEDPFYNPQADIDVIKEAAYGKDNDIDFRTRGERLAEADKVIGNNPKSFKIDDYTAHYVKGIGEKEITKTTGNPNATTTKFNSSPFWDNSTGKPGVTDDHAVEYLKSRPDVQGFIDMQVNDQMDDEIKKMKSSGDSRVDWMKGMSNTDIKNELINDPKKNIINQNDYGVRVRDEAKSRLNNAAKISSKVDVNYKNNNNGRWTNPNILHQNSINSYAQEAKTADGQMQTVNTYGPGGRFTQKNGRPIQLDTTNPVRTDINKGITTKNNKGSVKLNMTGYQLMPIKKGGAPFALKSSTPEQMIEEIQDIPNEYFDPNGKYGLQPDLKIGLNGYTLNEAQVLGDVNDKMQTIADQLADATAQKDNEKMDALMSMKESLDDVRGMVEAGGYDERDLLFAAAKSGIKKIQDNWIVPADDSDLAAIKNVTGGFDLKNKEYYSPEMKAVQEAWQKKYQQAQQEGFAGKKEPESEKTDTTIASDGKDLKSWTTENQYKVGNSVYYFDKADNTWKKK